MSYFRDVLWDGAYACRALRRQPAFALVAIGTLGLALGANTAMFGLVHRILLAHLPVREPERLVLLSRDSPDIASATRFSHLFFRSLDPATGSNDVLEGVLCRAVGAERVTVGTGSGGDAARGELVSGSFFEVLGVRPHLGRLIAPSDDVTPGAHPVVVLSYRYWQRRFSGDAAIVGTTLRITGVPMTVIGVSPPGFDGVDPGQAIDLRLPLAMQAEVRGGPSRPGVTRTTTLVDRRAADMIIVGRLRRDVDRVRAAGVLTGVLRRYLEESGPASREAGPGAQPARIDLQPAATGIGSARRQYQTSLTVMMAATVAVLIVACLNLASLMLARGSTRARELAVRAAIGAGPGRMVRQLLTESLVVSLGGAAVGACLAYPASALLIRLVSGGGASPSLAVEANWTLLLFHGLTAVVSVGLFGALPALASRRNGFSLLRSAVGTRSPVVARQAFLAAQVALSVVVLVGALLFVRTVHALRATELGLRTDRLLVLALSPQNAGRPTARTLPFFREVRDRVASLPGTVATTYAWIRPLSNASWRANVVVAGCCPGGPSSAFRNVVGPAYFETMGIPMAAGRDFTTADDRDAPKVAIVNETFARVHGGGQSVLGARIGVSSPEFTIVGIATDAKYAHVREPVPPVWFVPYEQQPNVKYLDLYVRTAGDPESMAANVRAAIAAVDPDVALFEMRSVEAQIDDLLVIERMVAGLASGFGSIGAALAALGVYGVLGFMVTARRREIGIRLALGAQPGRILREVLAAAWAPLAIGLIIGGAGAAIVTRYAASLLYGVSPLDLSSFGLCAIVISLVVTAAASIPARRASRVDPTLALREV